MLLLTHTELSHSSIPLIYVSLIFYYTALFRWAFTLFDHTHFYCSASLLRTPKNMMGIFIRQGCWHETMVDGRQQKELSHVFPCSTHTRLKDYHWGCIKWSRTWRYPHKLYIEPWLVKQGCKIEIVAFISFSWLISLTARDDAITVWSSFPLVLFLCKQARKKMEQSQTFTSTWIIRFWERECSRPFICIFQTSWCVYYIHVALIWLDVLVQRAELWFG